MLCVNAPNMLQLAVAQLQGVTVDVSIYRKRRDMLCQGLREIGYDFNVPDGAFYLFPRTPLPDDVKFVGILKEELILAVPGAGFGAPGYFRLSYAVPESTITGSFEGFRRAFQKAII
jgi:aspartate aminotransferase